MRVLVKKVYFIRLVYAAPKRFRRSFAAYREDKEYVSEYASDGRKVYKIGVTFSSSSSSVGMIEFEVVR